MEAVWPESSTRRTMSPRGPSEFPCRLCESHLRAKREVGRIDEAKDAAREVLRLAPDFSIEEYLDGLAYRNPETCCESTRGCGERVWAELGAIYRYDGNRRQRRHSQQVVSIDRCGSIRDYRAGFLNVRSLEVRHEAAVEFGNGNRSSRPEAGGSVPCLEPGSAQSARKAALFHSEQGCVMRMHSSFSRALLAMGLLMMMAALGQSAHAIGEGQTKFKRIPTQFITALGDPGETSGSGAQSWGLWRVDPGPRGVWLGGYEQLKTAGGVAPSQWKFDSTDWWLEEHGLIMEKPDFPVPPGKYIVTGNREVTTVLTVHPMDEDGAQRWELDNGANIHDVTHLRCRSARYTPATSNNSCSPAKARKTAFPVTPGGLMPPVEGCNKQDYAVLFVIGVAVEN